jgi:hypothetical protein
MLGKAKYEIPLGGWPFYDPAVQGDLVTPAISKFVQIINIGSQWICMSTISSGPGTVKIYIYPDIIILYNTAHSVAIRRACHMLMYNRDRISFVNERGQRQINFNDCGLFFTSRLHNHMIKEVCTGTMSTAWSLEELSLFQRRHTMTGLRKNDSGSLLCLYDAQWQERICSMLWVQWLVSPLACEHSRVGRHD